jgi:hypothetical protein
MFKLAAGGGRSNLPGPALRDVTPRQLPPARPAAGKLAAKAPPRPAESHGEWEEF